LTSHDPAVVVGYKMVAIHNATLNLIKRADRTGGDKYNGHTGQSNLDVYVPQLYSRPHGSVLQQLDFSLCQEEQDGAIKLTLTKQNRTRDDRYSGPNQLDLYLPQKLTRINNQALQHLYITLQAPSAVLQLDVANQSQPEVEVAEEELEVEVPKPIQKKKLIPKLKTVVVSEETSTAKEEAEVAEEVQFSEEELPKPKLKLKFKSKLSGFLPLNQI